MKIREDKIEARASRVAEVIQAPSIKDNAYDVMFAAKQFKNETGAEEK